MHVGLGACMRACVCADVCERKRVDWGEDMAQADTRRRARVHAFERACERACVQTCMPAGEWERKRVRASVWKEDMASLHAALGTILGIPESNLRPLNSHRKPTTHHRTTSSPQNRKGIEFV